MATGLIEATAVRRSRLTLTKRTIASPARPYRRDIDGLRGIAVLAVVAYHASASLLPGGFLGVDVFFVISGFLITGIVRAGIADGTFRTGDFLDRRLRRIVPALLLVLASTCLVGATTMFPDELVALGRSLWAGATFTSNLVLVGDGFRADYFAPTVDSNPLLHLWSLGVEEQFYLCWPLALLWLSRGGARWVREGTFVLLGAALASFVALAFEHPVAAFYLPSSRMWELLAGAVIASGRAEAVVPSAGRRGAGWRGGLALSGLSMLVIAFAGTPPHPAGRVVGTVMAVLGSVSVIAAGGDAWPNRKVLTSSALVMLGVVSYPWYLWHWPLLVFLRQRLDGPGALALTVTVAISLVLAVATYAYVERPLRRQSARAMRMPLLGTLALVVVVGVAAQRGWMTTPVAGERAVLAAASADWGYPGAGKVTLQPDGLRVVSLGAERPARTVLFLGDSHVEQYWPRVEALAGRLADSSVRVVFVTRSGCPPLPLVERLDSRVDACVDFTRTAFAYARRPEVTTVVIGARWEAYLLPLYGADPRGSPTLPVYDVNNGARDTLRADSPAGRRAAEQLAAAMVSLRAQGKNVVVIESNPGERRFDPKTMLDRVTRRRVAVVPLRAEAYTQYLAPVNTFLRIATGEGATARMLDPTPLLCPRKECTMVDSTGTPLYRDWDHMRAQTARRLTLVDSIVWRGAR